MSLLATVGNNRVADLVFTNDAQLREELLKALTFEVLHEETKPLRVKICWTKSKV